MVEKKKGGGGGGGEVERGDVKESEKMPKRERVCVWGGGGEPFLVFPSDFDLLSCTEAEEEEERNLSWSVTSTFTQPLSFDFDLSNCTFLYLFW